MCELKLFGRFGDVAFDRHKVYSFQNVVGSFNSRQELANTPLTTIIESPKSVRRSQLLAWVKSKVEAVKLLPSADKESDPEIKKETPRDP